MRVSETKPVKYPSAVLTEKFMQALAYATAIHGIDTRKGDGNTTPYMAHLLGVASLVLEAGGDEDQAIAGLLHDAVEDAGGEPRLRDIEARFGDDVAAIVRACSDSTDPEWKKRTPYWDRKQAYLDHLEQKADQRAVLVSIADKVHNARSIVTDLQGLHEGADAHAYLDSKFNATPEETLKYYSECLRIAELRKVPNALTLPMKGAVSVIRSAVH